MTEASAAFFQANRRRRLRSAVVAAVLVSVASTLSGAGTASAALDPIAKCQSSIGKAGRKLAKSHLGAWQACLTTDLVGKTCNTAARDAKLSVAGAKFIAGVRARCEGLALFTAAPAGLGFAQSCDLQPSAVDIAGCRDLSVTDAASLGACLLCWKRAELDGLVRAANPCLASQTPAAGGLTCGTPPAACPTDAIGRRCAAAIATTTLARAQARTSAMEICLDRKRIGKVTGTCPDAIAQKRLAAADAKAAAAMRVCQGAPPWWDECPRDTSPPCGPALATLDAIRTCSASIASAVADEMVCQQYPSAGADGLACPAAPTTTTTTTSTTTTTTLPASVCGDSAVEGSEQCDPPTSACGVGGVCDAACACIGSAPIITGISPPGAGLGAIVTISGAYFGSDAAAASVRFTYEESGETLQSTVPVLDAGGTFVRAAVPLVAPLKTNLVEVIIGAATSNAFPYETGGYPWDPTPDEPGSEITSLLALLDELARRFDLKLDPWFVGTGALSPAQATELHDAAAAMRQGIANFLASLAGTDPDVLRGVDGMLSAPLFLELRAKLQAAIDALHGSPTGEILCEAQRVVEILGDVLALLNVISTIIDIIVTTVTAACAVSVILAILTVGLAGPLAAIVCGGGLAAVIEILRTINEILAACAMAITAITYAAPTTPIPDTWTLQVQHDAWYGAEPDFVYVDGSPAVEARSWQDFHNETCAATSGCDISFTVDVFEVPVPVTITVPYMIVAHQPMDTDLAFPPGAGGAGFYAVASGIDGLSLFTGADVNGPQRVRGSYDVTFSADCTDSTGLLGSDTHSYDLIGGPHIVSISATHGQLGDEVEICAEDMPPNPSYVAVDFGDVRADVTPSGPGCYLFDVPDSAGTTPITLLGQGEVSDTSQSFTIDAPELDFIEPEAAFPGETVTLFGSGFAADPDNNVLTLDGTPLYVSNSSQTEIEFEVPDAPSGMLQLVAVGVHASNQIPLTVLHWSAPATLSLGSRDATRPAIAVNGAGAVGVVWADRSASGGLWRLLYTDVSPGHAAFRTPFEVSTDLGQFGDAPEKPAITALGDGDFLVAWITGDGSIRRMSIVPSGSTSVESVVATPPAGMAWHDVEVAAVRTSSVVVVAAEGQSFDASYLTELFSFTSSDNGASFGPATSFAGPAAYAGEIDLAWSNDRLVRAWRLSSNFFGPTLFTELSTDGLSFSLAEDASSDGGEGNEVPVRPSAAALDSGAIAAWEKPSSSYGEVLRVHGEPYGLNDGSTFSSGWAHDGHAALIADADDIATLAWVSRITGNSPDLVDGVPRVLVSRSNDAFESTTTSGLMPTVAPGDLDTVDSEPALGVGPDQRAHLVWLAGTPGARVVRYATTVDPGYADAPPSDDPAPVASAPHEWIAARLLESAESFAGELAIDLTDANRTRWLANGNTREHSPSLHPQIPGLLYMKAAEPALWDLGDGEAAIASPQGSSLTGPVVDVTWTPDRRIFGSRVQLYLAPEGWVDVSYDKLALSAAPWPALGGFGYVRGALLGVRFGEMQAAFSASGNYVALTHVVEVTDFHFEYSLEVLDLNAGSSTIFSFPDGSQPSWSPVEDKLVFVERIDADASDETYFAGVILHEWSVGDPAPTPLLTPAVTVDLALPRYSPDGTDVVYQRRDSLADPWFVELLSGSTAPTEVGSADTSPAWSPDGAALVFVRSVLPDFVTTYGISSELATWTIGSPAAQAITDLPDNALLGGAEYYDCSATGKVNECFYTRPAWVEMQP